MADDINPSAISCALSRRAWKLIIVIIPTLIFLGGSTNASLTERLDISL